MCLEKLKNHKLKMLRRLFVALADLKSIRQPPTVNKKKKKKKKKQQAKSATGKSG